MRTVFGVYRKRNEMAEPTARERRHADTKQAILRAARREPRVAYVSWADRLQVLLSLAAPRLSDRLLGRAFTWQGDGKRAAP